MVLSEPLTIGLPIGFPLVILGSILGTWRSKVPPPEAAGTGPELEDEPSPSGKNLGLEVLRRAVGEDLGRLGRPRCGPELLITPAVHLLYVSQ